MAKKLYVGNLSPQADGASSKTLFSMFGTVEKAYIIPDKERLARARDMVLLS